jgi:phosphate transport system permease protein
MNAKLLRSQHRFKRTCKGILLTLLTATCTMAALGVFLAIVGDVAVKGFSALKPELFTELPPPPAMAGGGIGNAVLGTVILVGLGAAISLPVSFLTAVYLSEFGRESRLSKVIRSSVYLLSTTPSIILGLFAYAAIVVATGSFSAVAGGVALSLVMLPILVGSMEEALRSVPDELRYGSLALGATPVQTLMQVVLPSAISSIITGAMLAVARASGESAPLIFTALFSQYWAEGLMAPTASLAVLIYNFGTSPFQNQQTLAWAGSLVLIAFVLVINITVRLASRSKRLSAAGKRG